MAVLLRKPEIAPGTIGVRRPRGLYSRTARPDTSPGHLAVRGRYERCPLPARHIELARSELSDAHLPLRAFFVVASWLARRRTHREAARRDHHHLGALGAVAKRLSVQPERLLCDLADCNAPSVRVLLCDDQHR